MPWDIAGHANAVAALAAAVKTNKVGHAYMFAGTAGLGKARLAKLFAQALLCEGSQDDAPCGNCRGCRQVAGGHHPDIHWLSPAGTSIGINQIRTLQTELALRPYEGRVKACIIDDADLLTEQAQNSMLKSLEEPPGSGVLILVAHRPSALLPTIHSRCQVLRFRTVEPKEITTLLQDKKGLPTDAASLLAALSEGKPGRAMTLEIEDLLAKRSEIAQWSASLRAAGWRSALSIAADLEKKEDLDSWLEMIAVWFRDIWHIWQDASLPLVNNDMAQALREEATHWGAGAAQALLALAEARQILRQNGNKRLTIDVMLMKMQRGLFYDSGSRRPLQAGR